MESQGDTAGPSEEQFMGKTDVGRMGWGQEEGGERWERLSQTLPRCGTAVQLFPVFCLPIEDPGVSAGTRTSRSSTPGEETQQVREGIV